MLIQLNLVPMDRGLLQQEQKVSGLFKKHKKLHNKRMNEKREHSRRIKLFICKNNKRIEMKRKLKKKPKNKIPKN